MSIKYDELAKGLTLVSENNIVVKLIKKGRNGSWLTDNPDHQFIQPNDVDHWQLPAEPEDGLFNSLEINEALFDNQGRLHYLKKKTETGWLTNQGHEINEATVAEFHRPTKTDVARLINRTDNPKQLEWIVKNFPQHCREIFEKGQPKNGSIDPTELEKNQPIIYINLEWQLEDIDYQLDGSARLQLRQGSKSVWGVAADCELPTAKQSPQPKPLLNLTGLEEPEPKKDNLPITPTYVYISDNETLDLHLEAFFEQPAIAIDTETTGLDPHSDRIRLLQLAAENRPVLVIDFFKISKSEKLKELLQHPRITKIAHNLKFDWKFLTVAGYEPKHRLFCSDIAEQLINAGLRPDHKLKDLCKKYLKIDLSKEEQVSDWMAENLTSEQLEYAAIDADVLVDLYNIIKPKIIEVGLTKIAGIEFKAIPAVSEIELNGMKLDLDRWREWVKQLEAEYKEISDRLKKQLKSGNDQLTLLPEFDTIDLDSHAQVLKSLKSLGVPITDTNFKTIAPLANDYPVIADLLEYRRVSKALSSFGYALPKQINPTTGRIHPNYWQMGSEAGRFSCSGPNLQQIPRGNVVRSCFVPEPGFKYVVADYSQIELRIAGEVSGDRNIIEAYQNDQDLHRLTASLMLKKPIDSVVKEERQIAKSANFGLIYGMGAEGYQKYAESNYGVKLSQKEAENFRSSFLEGYSGLNQWHYRTKKWMYRMQEKREMIVTRTLTNRRRLFPKPSLNQLLNTPVQGTGADIVKAALGKLRDALNGTGALIIGCIHDEIILEVPEANAEKAAVILSKTMEQAGNEILSKVPCVAESSIGESWADK